MNELRDKIDTICYTISEVQEEINLLSQKCQNSASVRKEFSEQLFELQYKLLRLRELRDKFVAMAN